MNEQLINDLRPFLDRITNAPLPSVADAGSYFYSQIHRIRVEAVSEICCSLLVRTQSRHGDQAAESLRLALEPIRESLLAEYPDCAALLDETWPHMGAIH